MGIESTSTSVTESIWSSESPRSAAPSATHSSGWTPLRGGLPKCSLDLLLDERHPALPADEDDLVDVLAAGCRFSPSTWSQSSNVRSTRSMREVVELLARERHADVERPALLLLDERQVDRDVRDERKVDLRRLGALLHPLHRDGRLGEVDLVLPPEVLEDAVDDPVVEVDAAEEGVAAGREHLEDVARRAAAPRRRRCRRRGRRRGPSGRARARTRTRAPPRSARSRSASRRSRRAAPPRAPPAAARPSSRPAPR